MEISSTKQWQRYQETPRQTNRPVRIDSVIQQRMRDFMRSRLVRVYDTEL